MLCRSEPEKIEPTSDCIESKKTCDCCCRPSCDDSKIVDECKEPTTYLPTEMTSKFNIMCESCHIRIVEFFVKYCYWCLILNLCFFREITSKFNISDSFQFQYHLLKLSFIVVSYFWYVLHIQWFSFDYLFYFGSCFIRIIYNDKKILHLSQNSLTLKISINITLSFLAISELPCETDGFAGNYDEDQTRTTPCNNEGN